MWLQNKRMYFVGAVKKTILLFGTAALAAMLITAPAHAQDQELDMPGFLLPEEPEPQPAPVKQPDRPLILIAEVATDPDPVIPGEPFILKLKAKNYGNLQGRRIVVTLQSQEGETTLKNFSPLGQCNTLYLDQLYVGYEKWLQCKLIAGPAVAGGIYNLVIHLSYINIEGDPFESTAVTGVMLEPQGTLDLIELSYPRTVAEGEYFNVSGYVVNSGGAPVRGVGVAVGRGENFELEQGETYFGTFNEGDSDVFDFSIAALQPGENILKLELYYSDAMNRKQTIERELQIEVMKIEETFAPNNGQAGGEENGSGGFWSKFKTFLSALFGLGGA